MRPSVLPLRTVAGGAVALRATVLPGAGATSRGRGPLRAVTLRTTVLPAAAPRPRVPIALGPVTLRTTVLPLRPVPRRTVALRTTILPTAATSPRRRGPLRTLTLRARVLARGALSVRPAARRPAGLPGRPFVTGGGVLVPITPGPLVAVAVRPRTAIGSGAVGPARAATSAAEAGRLSGTPSTLGTAATARSIGTASWTCHVF